jgi:hypothetical protein
MIIKACPLEKKAWVDCLFGKTAAFHSEKANIRKEEKAGFFVE